MHGAWLLILLWSIGDIWIFSCGQQLHTSKCRCLSVCLLSVYCVYQVEKLFANCLNLILPSVIDQGEGCCSVAVLSQQICCSLMTIGTPHEQHTAGRGPASVAVSLLPQGVGLLPTAV